MPFLVSKPQVDIQYIERSHYRTSCSFLLVSVPFIQVFIAYVAGTVLGPEVAIKINEEACP